VKKQLAKSEQPARLQIIACGALARELLVLIDQLPDGAVALTCLPASWHNHPEKIVPASNGKLRLPAVPEWILPLLMVIAARVVRLITFLRRKIFPASLGRIVMRCFLANRI
jgi:hypothetical protein